MEKFSWLDRVKNELLRGSAPMSTLLVQNEEIRFKAGGAYTHQFQGSYAVQNGSTEFMYVFCNIDN